MKMGVLNVLIVVHLNVKIKMEKNLICIFKKDKNKGRKYNIGEYYEARLVLASTSLDVILNKEFKVEDLKVIQELGKLKNLYTIEVEPSKNGKIEVPPSNCYLNTKDIVDSLAEYIKTHNGFDNVIILDKQNNHEQKIFTTPTT